ncbi:XRE family transcriptional regulator [Streptomyces griseoluteus]|uniref:XRE family transcriptional regulator n=1 Tax=Streptomyces griseoluteus TaxID=29306 RepID=UPI0036FBC324
MSVKHRRLICRRWYCRARRPCRTAGGEKCTTPPPRTLKGQINHLLAALRTSRTVAAEIGVTADSVNGCRRGARKNPPSETQGRIDQAVRSGRQLRVRERSRHRAAARTGMMVEFRATFGHTPPIGSATRPASASSPSTWPRGPAVSRAGAAANTPTESSPRQPLSCTSRTGGAASSAWTWS